ncbi:hypothetical protein J7426_23005 [Tropicibacter sp. R16_0]|uniref:hypothetical protein n=1 Tax=Tropicibacter sp. R16_0 TaxID=2821102 RepID=UPI001ADBCC1E|nr:hypothetical protein [Tropicibacter sp. R16_0]MBO9453150.1 hypothetical protein [Tropicibacter sp. R16_0]
MTSNTYYVEYLIVGSISVALFLFGSDLVLTLQKANAKEFQLVWALMIVPISYMCGILVDAVGYLVMELPVRRYTGDYERDRKEVKSAASGPDLAVSDTREKAGASASGIDTEAFSSILPRHDSRTAFIIVTDGNLYAHLRMLRSRDRMVRGSTLALFASCLLDIVPGSGLDSPKLEPDLDFSGDWLRWVATFVLFWTWFFLHAQTRRFKDTACKLYSPESS